jgi:integrase
MEAAKGNRWGHRDATMVLVAYRHGLRVSELVDLRWDQVDFRTARRQVRRASRSRLSRNLDLILARGVVAVANPHANKPTIHILAAVAEHEREAISERTKAAPAVARHAERS